MNTMHRHRLLGASIAAILRGGLVASACTLACAAPALAQEQARTYAFDIPAQDLGSALRDFARSSGQQVTFEDAAVRGKRAPALKGSYSLEAALDALIRGTGLEVERGASGLFIVRPAATDAPMPADQAAAGDVQEMETLVVTGTNIRGIAPDSSPLSIYTRDDIDRSGQATVQGFLRVLPENFGGGATDNDAGSTSAPGSAYTKGTGVNLRGLGNDATLVLVNGRRVAPIGTGDFADVSLVPTAAVARIDVLKDGASAIYGSDAIAGVVNIVLQDDYDGAETRLRTGAATQGGGEEYGFGQTWGKAWSSGHALVSYDYHRRDPVQARDRHATRNAPEQLQLLPEQRRHGLFASAAQDVGERVQLFGQFLHGDRQMDAVVEANAQLFRSAARIRQSGLTLGFDADLDGNWRFELASSYNRSRSVGDTVYATGAAFHSDRRSSVWATDAKLDGKLFRAPGGDVRVAAGAQFRKERYLSPRGDGTRYNPDREVVAGFAEVFVPFVGADNARPGLRRLELTAAVRHEHYSDFGRTTNPKLGVLWSPARGLNLRGTYGKSFRAPNFDELDEESAASVLLYPLPDPQLGGALSPVLLRFGMNATLGPERATTWTAGADWTSPEGGFRASATWFSIDFRDRIGSVSTNILGVLGDIEQLAPYAFRNPDPALIQELVALPYYTDFCGCPPETAVAFVDMRLQNLASDQVEGLDLDARYRWQAGDDHLFELSANATRLFAFERRSSPAAPEVDVLATVFNPPKWRVRAGLAWSRGRWGAATFVNYVDNYQDSRFSPVIPVSSWTTVDATFGFRPGASGWQLLLSATNLFDSDPPFIRDPLNNVHFDGANASALGRMVALQVSKTW